MSESLGEVSINVKLDGPRAEKLIESVLQCASPLSKQTVGDRFLLDLSDKIDLQAVAGSAATQFLASEAAKSKPIRDAAKKAVAAIGAADNLEGLLLNAARSVVKEIIQHAEPALRGGLEHMMLHPDGILYQQTQAIILNEINGMVRRAMGAGVSQKNLASAIGGVAAKEAAKEDNQPSPVNGKSNQAAAIRSRMNSPAMLGDAPEFNDDGTDDDDLKDTFLT